MLVILKSHISIFHAGNFVNQYSGCQFVFSLMILHLNVFCKNLPVRCFSEQLLFLRTNAIVLF